MKNLRTYWKEHCVHVAIGALGGYLLVGDYPYAGIAIVVSQLVRQTVGFWQKRDTVSMDMAYCQAGMLVGVAVGLVVNA